MQYRRTSPLYVFRSLLFGVDTETESVEGEKIKANKIEIFN